MLPCDRALDVGEPRFARHIPEGVVQTGDRVCLTGARGAQQLLRGFPVMLESLYRRESVIDLAWCCGHDRHLQVPASASGGRERQATSSAISARGGNIPFRGLEAPSRAGPILAGWP